jgi:hypothetical protein
MEEIDRDLGFEQRCPLCGGDNHCGMAASPPRNACWCATVEIIPELLAKLPESSRGRSCLCPDCCAVKGDVDER